MNNFAYDLVLNPWLTILMIANAISSWAAEVFLQYDSMIVKSSATVSLIVLIITGVAKYCKIVNDNRAAREATRVNELLLEKMRLENEKLKKELEDKE